MIVCDQCLYIDDNINCEERRNKLGYIRGGGGRKVLLKGNPSQRVEHDQVYILLLGYLGHLDKP